MNHKQRVAAAIARKPADKVPLGFYVVDGDTVEKVIGRKTFIRSKPGIQLALWQGRRDEVAESLKQDSVEFYRKMDIADLLTLKLPQRLPPRGAVFEMPRKIDQDTYEDSRGRIWKLAWESNEVNIVHDPRSDRPEMFAPEMFPLPNPDEHVPADESCFEACDYFIERLGGERYIMSLPELGCFPLLGGMEHGLLQWALAPDAVAAAARRSGALGNLSDCQTIRPGSDGAMLQADMAGTNGLMVSPKQWREISLPVLRDRVRHVRQFVPQVTLHCCGRTFEIMDDLAEAGVDCYQSLQTFAGMTPDVLCRQYGDRMAFWGGAPVELLVAGTPDQMRRAVRDVLEKTAGHPGFIFGPSHSIAFGTRYDNFMAMLEEFDRLRDRL